MSNRAVRQIQTLELMQSPRNTLRVVFSLSVLLTAFWVSALAWATAFGENNLVAGIVAVVVATVVSWLAFREGRIAIAVPVEAGVLLRALVPRIVGSYLIAVPLVGLVVWALATLAGADQRPGDATFIAIIFAWWLPLWAAPALGAEWSWRVLRKRKMA